MLIFLACASPDLSVPALVPLPNAVEDLDGSFLLTNARFAPGVGTEDVAERIAAEWRAATGLDLPVDEGAIILDIDPDLGPEAYTIEVGPKLAVLTGGDVAGVYWASQTALQLLQEDDGWRLPAVSVQDAPRFAWRGFMIDVARHFFPPADIERQVDLMAAHKLNRLHLHLTDDQGWRIEIQSWPDLTTIGGSTEVGGGEGGWYTQDEYVALVEYAAERQITLVPEIDFPGHSHAALASYAALNESGVAEELYTGAGVISTPLWVDGPATAGFVSDVLGEVAALTPGEWIHVGGDEAVDLTAEEYAPFVESLQATVEAEGKTLIGWDEIGPVELEAPYLVQHWYDLGSAEDAVARGAQMIRSPAESAYFDMVYDDRATYGQVWAGQIDLEAAYSWDVVPAGLDETEVLGVEGALWAEYIDDQEKMDFMAWPRMVALAEVGWSAEQDWEGFMERLPAHGERLDAMGVGYYRTPEVRWR
jgi:hexosaminidase